MDDILKKLKEDIEMNLNVAKVEEIGSEEGIKAHRMAMEAIDRYEKLVKANNESELEQQKIDYEREKELEKIRIESEKNNTNLEIENRKLEDSKKSRRVKLVTDICIGVAIPAALFAGKCAFNWQLSKALCNFEKDYNFVTKTAANNVSNMLK